MTALVIGSRGRIGRVLCEGLRRGGEPVVEFDLVRDASEDARVAVLPLDGCDRVFFLAWNVGGAKYLNDPSTYVSQMEWNSALLQNVMPQVTAASVPFVFVSSQWARDPTTPYGLTKRLGEMWAAELGGSVVRVWDVYGTLEPISRRSQAVSDFVMQAVHRGRIDVLTSGRERRRFVHVDDVATGLTMAAARPQLAGATVDLAGPVVSSIRDVATMVADIAGADVSFADDRGKEADLTDFSNLSGWVPERTLLDGVTALIKRATDEARDLEWRQSRFRPSRQERDDDMSNDPTQQPVPDEELQDAAGGRLAEDLPANISDPIENDTGMTAC